MKAACACAQSTDILPVFGKNKSIRALYREENLTRGFSDVFHAPHSRCAGVRQESIEKTGFSVEGPRLPAVFQLAELLEYQETPIILRK